MTRHRHYILKDKELVAVSLIHWALWLETANRHIGDTMVGHTRISTIFIGLDHNHSPKGPPLLFETMIFPDQDAKEILDRYLENYLERYSTYDQAVEGHQRAVERVVFVHKIEKMVTKVTDLLKGE